jgi:hypothetical protein
MPTKDELQDQERWRIRRIFLTMDRNRDYLLREVARVTGYTQTDLRRRIKCGSLQATDRRDVWFVSWPEIASLALQRWSIPVIEENLDADAATVLPPLVRARRLTAMLPGYQVGMLESLARREGITVDACLANHLLDLAAYHADEMNQEMPGFVDAMRWPDEG